MTSPSFSFQGLSGTVLAIRTGSLRVLCARKRNQLASSVPEGIKQSQHVENMSQCMLHNAAPCCAMLRGVAPANPTVCVLALKLDLTVGIEFRNLLSLFLKTWVLCEHPQARVVVK